MSYKALSVLMLLSTAASAAETQEFRDSNACVPLVPAALDRLARTGSRFHVRTTANFPSGTQRLPQGLLNGNFMRHIQGVARLQGRNTLAMAGNASGGSYLYVAPMGSLAEEGPWASNVKCRDGVCSSPRGDQFARIVPLSRKFDHPGGIQSLGDLVVVGTDISVNDSKGSQIRFFDLRDPLAPAELSHLLIDRPGKVRTDAVAATKLLSGPYRGLTLIAAIHKTYRIVFYLSTRADLRDPATRFAAIDSWEAKEHFKLKDYQGIQLVQQCDGELFLTGTHKSKPFFLPWGGKDWLDVHSLRLYSDGRGAHAQIDPYRSLHMTLKHSLFTAGAGVYVDDIRGGLMVYASDYWPLNPFNRDTVIKFEQFGTR